MTAQEDVRLLCGDSRALMATLEPESVDSIVTDPPYGLGFMGKGWDHGVPGVEFWTEALRVAKPGAHLLAFGGTRTFHRLAVAIEDAGWEIRDCVMWAYGCLSEDTEVLTPDGWERYHTARTKEILAYDPQADVYQWEKPERWSAYRVEQDTAFRVASDSTDQIVSRNHRCLVERGGTLAFVAAEECAGVERVPYLQGDLSALPQGRGALLFEGMQRQGEGLAETALRERQGQEAAGQGAGRPEEPGVEGRLDLLQAEGQVRRPVDQVRSLSCGVRSDGAEGRLRHGASAASGDGVGATAVAERVRPSRQPRRDGQPAREPDAVRVECGSQKVRARPSYRTTLASVTAIKYTGLIFCPTVSTGAFVARRNGKVFITGNSGFPKSLDVSKAIDKAAGEIRPRVPGGQGGANVILGARKCGEAISGEAKQWQGWGTALKPAWEPVIVARKPFKGTVAANVLAHGTGALNIDGCRVPGEPWKAHSATGLGSVKFFTEGETPVIDKVPHDAGRWPANVIHDGSEEVLALFPVVKGQQGAVTGNEPSSKTQDIYGNFAGRQAAQPRGDNGSAARFFYCAKASRKDRNEGCEAKNHHPTVKPTELMRYLCRLVTPPGGVVLDPFMGSGSTGKAAAIEGFDFIGIELEPEYFKIAQARIGFVEAICK